MNRFSGSTETIVVSTDGQASCSATVVYAKLPGQRCFMAQRVSNGDDMVISPRLARTVTCAISSD